MVTSYNVSIGRNVLRILMDLFYGNRGIFMVHLSTTNIIRGESE